MSKLALFILVLTNSALSQIIFMQKSDKTKYIKPGEFSVKKDDLTHLDGD